MNFKLITEILGFGFDKVKKHFFFYFKSFIIAIVTIIVPLIALSLVGAPLSSSEDLALSLISGSIIAILIVIFLFLIQSLLYLGYIAIALNIVDGKSVSIKMLFSSSNLILKYYLSTILFVLVMVGFFLIIYVPVVILTITLNLEILRVLSIIPVLISALYITLTLRFYPYLVVDKKFGPLKSLRESFNTSKNHFWLLLLWGLIIYFLNLGGTLLLFIGLLLTTPWIMISDAYLYRKLFRTSMQPAPHTQEPSTEQELPLVVPSPLTQTSDPTTQPQQ